MAGTKEIRAKIASVKNTQKITKAMEMVAASKMRKAQDRMHAARPYANKIRNVIAHVGHANPEYRHPYLTPREVKRVGLILVSTDRGLCGGLNANLFRESLRRLRAWEGEGKEADLCIIGAKGAAFFSRVGGRIVGQTTHIGDQPSLESLIGAIRIMLDAYLKGTIDQLFIVSNQFINSMTQRPVVEQLIPVEPGEADAGMAGHWDYIYEPDAEEVLTQLLNRYIESLVYQSVVENIASEQAARMVAMKAASDNAGNIIDDLALAYNKARQAAITQELSEIVGGAAAV